MRRLIASTTTALVLAVLLAPAVAPASAGARLHTLVNYRQTGGFVGIDLQVVVHTNATATVLRRGAPTRHPHLSRATMARLRHALDIARVDQEVKAGPGGCADCFLYSVGYHGHHRQFSDVDAPDRYRPALRVLQAIAGPG